MSSVRNVQRYIHIISNLFSEKFFQKITKFRAHFFHLLKPYFWTSKEFHVVSHARASERSSLGHTVDLSHHLSLVLQRFGSHTLDYFESSFVRGQSCVPISSVSLQTILSSVKVYVWIFLSILFWCARSVSSIYSVVVQFFFYIFRYFDSVIFNSFWLHVCFQHEKICVSCVVLFFFMT